MRTEILLEVQESNLNVRGRLKKIAKLLVKDEYTTVIGVLEPVLLDVRVDRAGYEAARDELTLLETEERAELVGNLLLAVEAVVLRAVRGLLAVGIVLLSLDLSNNLGERLKFRTKGSNLGKYSFNRHCTLYMYHTFKYITFYNFMFT